MIYLAQPRSSRSTVLAVTRCVVAAVCFFLFSVEDGDGDGEKLLGLGACKQEIGGIAHISGMGALRAGWDDGALGEQHQ